MTDMLDRPSAMSSPVIAVAGEWESGEVVAVVPAAITGGASQEPKAQYSGGDTQ